MFCPKCAAQNLDGASYCRGCGANISLVPQAITGTLPTAEENLSRSERRALKRHSKEASLERACKNAFMGLAFLLVAMALAFSRMGTGWWFWMLIPAFSLFGTGVAQYIRYREDQKRPMMPGAQFRPIVQAPQQPDQIPASRTGELLPSPPSVTEGTTRHLGVEAPTRHFDPSAEPRK